MNHPMFEYRGVECWVLEWRVDEGEVVARGLTYGIDGEGVEVAIPAGDLRERFTAAVDAWCEEHGVEGALTFEEALRRIAPGSVWAGDAESFDAYFDAGGDVSGFFAATADTRNVEHPPTSEEGSHER